MQAALSIDIPDSCVLTQSVVFRSGTITPVGVEAIDGIASTHGVDGVFVRPSDLAADLGNLGNLGDAEVQTAIEQAFARIVAAGVLIAGKALARRYLQLGATFMAVGADMTILAQGAEGSPANSRASLRPEPERAASTDA